jgi:hypothetical protein
MGVNLERQPLADFLGSYGPDSRTQLLAKLERHIGARIPIGDWNWRDADYPKVGTYAGYGVFRLCLELVTRGGDLESTIEGDDDQEKEALKQFRIELRPSSLRIPYSAHLLDTGDTDTIFLPILFRRPFEYDELFFGSLPGASRALEKFAKGLRFDLRGSHDPEEARGKWRALATVKNIARILYTFFSERPDACVVLG